MKYSSLTPGKTLEYKIDNFSGGVNLKEGAEFIKPNQISKCKNMWYKEGILTTRPAIKTDKSKIIQHITSRFVDNVMPFTVTDTTVYVDNVKKNIAYYAQGDGISYVQLHVFLLDNEGSLSSIGTMLFQRISQDEFYVPDNVFFIVGDTISSGSGIFAFVHTKSGKVTIGGIYELSADLTTWERYSNTSYYEPAIYINGRGTRYDETLESEYVFTDTPTELEPLNMITSPFRAYFTSDGLSSDFQLPVTNLDNNTVICDLYGESEGYFRWIIYQDQTSATINMWGNQIKMTCDRQSGRITFYNGTNRYSLPKMVYNGGNNMIIRANKTVVDGAEKIFTSKGGFVHNSKVYLYGNKVKPNEIYEGSLSNLLYFKKTAKTKVGNQMGAITGIAMQNNKLIAFKPAEIYRIDVTEGKKYSLNTYLREYGTELTENDELSAVLIHSSIGCDCPETIKTCADRTIWANSNGDIYLLATTTYGKENNVYKISHAIDKELSAIEKDKLIAAKSVDCFGHYLLLVGNKVYLLDYSVKGFGYSASYMGDNYEDKGVVWYMWEFPENHPEINYAFGSKEGLNLICHNSDRTLIYMASLGGEEDCILAITDGEIEKQNFKVQSEFSTLRCNLGSFEKLKNLEEIYITADFKGKISFIADCEKIKQKKILKSEKRQLRSFHIKPFIHGTDYITLSFKSETAFSVANILIRFKNISKDSK